MSLATQILVVDDEVDFEQLITQQFRRQIREGEFVFSFARNGEQALGMLQSAAGIELMLLDINMPVMDGLTLMSRLRELQSPVRAIIVSAYGDMRNIRTAMNRGAFDFVTKPIDLADLEATMRKTLADIAKLRELDRRRLLAERARTNLARYFSPNIVDVLAERDEPLGPVRRQNVAILFADIVGFTTMSEGMPPEIVVELLRKFYDRMASQIFNFGGSVEKYMGDAIIATFGIPVPSDQDASQALKCANGMLSALDTWNLERIAAGEPSLRMGIGLNYGPAVIGDVGSAHSMSFTVIGDTVNTASRLQELTRKLDTPLLASEAILEATRGWPDPDLAKIVSRLRDGGEQVLRGRNTAVRVWLDPKRQLHNQGNS